MSPSQSSIKSRFCVASISYSRGETYLESMEPFLREVPDLRVGSWDIAGSGLRELLLPFPAFSFVLYIHSSRPSSELSRRWYARSRCRGQGQVVRDGEPVRAPESRCSGAPLLTRKRIARARERERAHDASLLGLKEFM